MKKRLLGFISLPLLSALSPLLLLPIAARVGGPAGWASFATAQALGTAAGTLISYGWYIIGPPRIAMASDLEERSRIFAEASRTKTVIAIVVLPFVGLCAVNLAASDYRITALVTAIASAIMIGFTFSWFQIGLGKPKQIAQYETVPRLFGTMLSCLLILWSGELAIYGLVMIAVTCFSLIRFNLASFGKKLMVLSVAHTTVKSSLRIGLPAAGVAIVGLGFTALPLPLVAAMESLADASQFASAQKLYVYGLIVITASMDAVQAWALEAATDAERDVRFKRVVASMLGIGVAGALVLAGAGEILTTLLFGEDVAANKTVVTLFGVAYLASALNTPTVRLILIPLRRSREVFANNVIAVICGVLLMLVGQIALGVLGVAIGLAVGQVLYAILNWISVWKHRLKSS